MKFYRLRDIDLQKVKLIPREDLEADGSYIAFDVIGDVDTRGFYACSYHRFTVFKFWNGTILLEIKCKYSPKPRAHYSTIETRGICSADEAAYEVYSVRKVSVNDVSMLEATTDNIVTLATCVMNQPDYRWCVQARQR